MRRMGSRRGGRNLYNLGGEGFNAAAAAMLQTHAALFLVTMHRMVFDKKDTDIGIKQVIRIFRFF